MSYQYSNLNIYSDSKMEDMKKNKKESPFLWGIFFLIIIFFFILKVFGIHYAVSDENIYFYMSKLILEGYTPYKDFFFAHPPFHLYFSTIFYMIFGFSYTVSKFLPVIASLITAVFLFLLLKKLFKAPVVIIVLILFLFSHDLLRASSHFTGINVSIMFMCIALYYVFNNEDIHSGIAFGFGVLSGFYILPGFLMIATLRWFKGKYEFKRLLISFVGFALFFNLFFSIYGGDNYYKGVYKYHFNKPEMTGKGSTLQKKLTRTNTVLFHNFFLFWGAFLAPVSLFIIGRKKKNRNNNESDSRLNKKKEKRKKRKQQISSTNYIGNLLWNNGLKGSLIIFTLFCSGYLFFLFYLKQIFHFYYLLLFLPLALLSGHFFQYLIDLIIKAKNKFKNSEMIEFKKVILVIFFLLLLFIPFGFFLRSISQHKLGYYDRQYGKTSYYKWPGSILPESINNVVKKLFWRDDRTIGDLYSGVEYYLWHESRYFSTASDIVETLIKYAKPDDLIFGDSTSTPLIAIMSSLGIASNFVDTNSMRFRSGTTSVKECINKIDLENLKFILVNDRKGFYILDEFKQYINDNYKVFKTFKDPYFGRYILYNKF